MSEDDRAAVTRLLDSELGRGLWGSGADLGPIGRVAIINNRIVGVGTAALLSESPAAVRLPTPVGHLRLVAVDRDHRRRGIATDLVAELSRACELRGAASLIAYAWVYGSQNVAALSGALERNGFVRDRRIDGFYRETVGARCPGCGQSPCVCAADIYYRVSDRPGRTSRRN